MADDSLKILAVVEIARQLIGAAATHKTAFEGVVQDAKATTDQITALLQAMALEHRWTGTMLQLRKPDGSWGAGVDLKPDSWEFRGTATHLQGRIVGAPTWQDLVAWDDVAGPWREELTGLKIAAQQAVTDAASLIVSAPVVRKVISASSYTILAEDMGMCLDFTSANPVTVTLSPSMEGGFHCLATQCGLGRLTFLGGHNAYGYNKSYGLDAQISLRVRDNVGGNAAYWLLSGELTV
jgi:hypothetical protein